jgi:hypothetical protein
MIHGHHRDYRKPLFIVWLCPKCHGAEHAGRIAPVSGIDYSQAPKGFTIPIRLDLPETVHAALKSKASLKRKTLKAYLADVLKKASK